jgi:hypothetical protein
MGSPRWNPGTNAPTIFSAVEGADPFTAERNISSMPRTTGFTRGDPRCSPSGGKKKTRSHFAITFENRYSSTGLRAGGLYNLFHPAEPPAHQLIAYVCWKTSKLSRIIIFGLRFIISFLVAKALVCIRFVD